MKAFNSSGKKIRPILYLIVTFMFSISPTICLSTNLLGKSKGSVSPFEYGLAKAKNGVERYQVLLRTHKAAVAAGVDVDYTGIDTIQIEIPSKPSPIPLNSYNNFKGCVFVVKNISKNCFLFNTEEKDTPIIIDKKIIDSGDFQTIDSLKHGRYLLLIEDEIPWVQNRIGYSYGHQRRDILLIENGIAKNSLVMPYDNEFSAPKCSYIKLGNDSLIIKNIKIERDPDCTFLTHIAYISGFDNVQISNVSIHTPQSTLTDDRGIRIYNCTNVSLDSVYIDGTYSQKDHSGYGLSLGNIWNFRANKLYGRGNWGIFGNNNVNTAKIENSKINRFDIHCYGKDISFSHVDFFDYYNQFASVYGTICFDKCKFTNFIPIANGSSYNAFVAYDVLLNDCVFNATPKKNYVLWINNKYDEPNARHELSEKCWPNVKIKNLRVNMKEGVKELYLFHSKVTGSLESSVGYLSNISLDGLTIMSDGVTPVKSMALSDIKIKTKKPVECSLSNVKISQPSTMMKTNGSDYVSLKINMPVKGINNIQGFKIITK